jgi:hypothetical protein
MARKILATIMVLLGVSAATLYLFYVPTNVTFSITDPPPQGYDSRIQAIYVTLTRVEIHAADAGNDSGWYALASGATVNLLAVLNVSKVLGNAPLPPGKYSEIRFFAGQATVKISGVNVTYTIPGEDQTGIKVVITGGGFRIFGGQRLNVLLDLAFRNTEIMNNPTRSLTPVATAKVVY